MYRCSEAFFFRPVTLPSSIYTVQKLPPLLCVDARYLRFSQVQWPRITRLFVSVQPLSARLSLIFSFHLRFIHSFSQLIRSTCPYTLKPSDPLLSPNFSHTPTLHLTSSFLHLSIPPILRQLTHSHFHVHNLGWISQYLRCKYKHLLQILHRRGLKLLTFLNAIKGNAFHLTSQTYM